MLGNKRKITDLKVVELRVELEKRGLDTKGLKGVLVQRLQKSIEDDGGDGSEIEISGSETSSPKPSSRRSIGRSKRAQTDENTESSQDEDKCEMFASNTASEKPGEELSEGDKEQEEDFLTEQIVDEDSLTAFEKTQHPSFCQDNFSHHQDEDSRDVGGELYQDAEEISDSEEKMSIFHENLAQEEGDGKSNNYRTHEEDSMDVPQEEEGGLTEDMMADDWRKEVEESVDNQDELEGSEEVVVEEIETAVVEKWDHVQETVQTDDFQITEPASKLEARAPSQEKKKATNEKDPEVVVVGNEDDVLDMLDYDLEITGEQNNLNVNSEEVAKKTEKNNENGKNTDKKTEAANREECDPSPEKKSRSTADSQQKKSNPDQSKSAKSNSSKDGRKESSKKDTSPNRNLWISGLSSATRASELKSAFSRYGKVIGAKVVTNVKSPGSRCYGYITMTSVEAAKKCILHLNNTEMHGRMITVEVAKGDPSASSKRQSSSSASTSSAKKETDPKDHGKKEISDSKTASTTRKSSSSAQISIKADKGTSEGQGKVDSDKKSDSSGLAGEHKKSEDKDKSGKPKPKSPNRERPRDTTNGTSQRSGDKRHQNRSPGGSNDGTRQRYNKDEPERKRVRQPNSADRKVVLDSHKGELRVNVSALDRSRQGPRDDRPGIASRNIISRRRSISPVRRRPDTSPIRGQGSSRAGIIINRGGRGAFRNRTSRGRGLLSRQSVGSGRQTGLAMLRGQRGSAASQFRVQRDRVRARLPIRLRERGGLPTHTERDRLRREREEREKLRLERERLERERRQLEKDRQERERLEQERLRLEQERKRELERIEREKAEMRRLQEITRYEAEQRQRAIKRSYDDDVPIGHRGSRSSNRDTYESKRAMMASTGDRDGRRADREERRTYGGYNSREGRNGNRAGASPPVSYRSSQNSFRNTGPGKMTGRQIESRRQIAADSHDTDARYIGVGSGATALVRRTEDKYDRRDQGRAMEYGHSYDRESASDRRIESPTRRRGGQSRGNVPNHRDGRKVITRERGDQRGSSPDFRRSTRGNISRIEITRVEQSPPPRRQRRGSSPPTNVRGSTWRGSKGDSSRRDDDRDLREQLRGRQTSNMTASYGDSGRDRERGSQRRAALVAGSGSVSPVRSGGQYQSRWPSDSADSGPIYSVNSSSNPIPTQTGRAGSAASWHSLSSSWQQSAASSGRTGWPGSAMASTTSVGRPIMPSTHTLVPSATAMVPVPPGTAIIPASANQAYLPTTDRQSRSFQTPYKITRRY